jgi:hypothetical protein
MSILNSISRGFGSQIGRHAANKVLNSSKQTMDNGVKNYLSFWEGIKTMLWFPIMVLVATFANTIYNMIFNDHFLDKGYTPNFKVIMIIAMFMTFCIGYDYYKTPKYK